MLVRIFKRSGDTATLCLCCRVVAIPMVSRFFRSAQHGRHVKQQAPDGPCIQSSDVKGYVLGDVVFGDWGCSYIALDDMGIQASDEIVVSNFFVANVCAPQPTKREAALASKIPKRQGQKLIQRWLVITVPRRGSKDPVEPSRRKRIKRKGKQG